MFIWLSSEKTTPYVFYQFWLNADDAGVIDYMKIYTTLPKEEIDMLEQNVVENPGARKAQKVLAFEVTKLVHGEEKAKSVQKVTEVLFGGTPVHELDEQELAVLEQEIPTVKNGSVIEALVIAKIAGSNGEAQRLVASNAISVDGAKVDAEFTFGDRPALLKKGKNTFVLVKP